LIRGRALEIVDHDSRSCFNFRKTLLLCLKQKLVSFANPAAMNHPSGLENAHPAIPGIPLWRK
jgi:hypothetical protein